MGRNGPISGTYTGNRNYTGNINFAQGATGAGFNFIKKDTQIWYVDSGKQSPAASGNGLTWEGAFITLQEAVTAAGAFDTILIAPNAIQTVAAAGIDITQEGLKIFGAGTTPAGQVSALKCTGTAAMFRIAANRVEIGHLYMSQRGAYTCIEIGTAAVGAVYETHIHHCNFDGYGTCTYAIAPYGTTDTVCLVVEDCYFMSCATAAIQSNGTRDSYLRNTIIVGADTTGIEVAKTGGNRHWGVIADNLFLGKSGSSTNGIEYAGNSTAGSHIAARNLFAGTWNDAIVDNTGDPGVENYEGSTTGGSLIDCNSSS